MPQIHTETFPHGLVRKKAFIKASEVVALGAAVSGQISLWTVPANAIIRRARVENGGTLVATLATLTASLGKAATSDGIMAATAVHAASAVAETGLSAAQSLVAKSVAYDVIVEFVGDANLSTMTGASPGGFIVTIEYETRQ